MDSSNLVHVEAELSPESIEEWLSVIKDRKKMHRRSDLSMTVKKHLSALGWCFFYAYKHDKRELRYKSPNGKVFYSLATACMSLVDQDSQEQLQIVPIYELACSPRNLSSRSSLDASKQKQKNKRRKRFDTHESPKEENCSSDLIKFVPSFDVLNEEQEKKMMIVNRVNRRRRRFDSHESTPKEENCSSDLIKFVPSFDVLNEEQEKKMMIVNRVEACDTAAFNGQTFIKEKIKINLDVANQQQKKRKTASGEITAGKSLKKILQAKEKKHQMDKCGKESLRFWRSNCGSNMNCDVCCVCHWGGDLLLCDGCPSSFHCTCLGLSSLPEEDLWFCPRCCCDICGLVDLPENSKLMTCEQCQRRCHLNCLKEEPCIVSCSGWFCSTQCHRVYSRLQNLLGRKIAVGNDGDMVWTLMRAPNEYEHYDDEQISKLNSAVEILHQGFEPSKDTFTGRDIVEELAYRRDGIGAARGFYTVLIERENEPITVATVRVHKDVAEIPLVATLPNYRRCGMCRVLMDELEKQMSQMGVFRLVLPAIQEVLTTWTLRFGFSVMESSERLKLVRYGVRDFLGTVMCHKFLQRERGDDSATKSSLTD